MFELAIALAEWALVLRCKPLHDAFLAEQALALGAELGHIQQAVFLADNARENVLDLLYFFGILNAREGRFLDLISISSSLSILRFLYRCVGCDLRSTSTLAEDFWGMVLYGSGRLLLHRRGWVLNESRRGLSFLPDLRIASSRLPCTRWSPICAARRAQLVEELLIPGSSFSSVPSS